MAAGIAHELNQPLVGVRGLAEHLLISHERNWDLDQERVKDRLGRIVAQADRMTHIIEHVRMFAREAGKPEMAPVQVNEVVNSSIEMLGAQFRAHDIELTAEPAGDLPLVLANFYSLEEVLLNLLNNARDVLEEGGGANGKSIINVRTRQTNGTVSIEVIDNGEGMPDGVAMRAFDPFFTTKDPDRGTGLGLSICKGIIEELDGTIAIESQPGRGTTVRIEMPAVA